MRTYEDCVSATSTKWAPWYVVPADHKLVTRAVVADVSLPAMSGIDFAREAARRCPETRVLVLTMHARQELATGAFEAGARGYALKTELPTAIVEAIRAVARGELYLSPSLPRSVLSRRASEDPLGALTTRERAVFSLVVGGLSNESIPILKATDRITGLLRRTANMKCAHERKNG